jgi:DNA-binding PadR family transcriptional regulator
VSTSPAEHHHSGNISPEFALLGFLIAGPDHGYNLHQKVAHELGQVWHLSQSQAYATLKRLEQRGDIAVRRVEQETRPDRQLLRITAQGRRRFMAWLEQGSSTNARAIRLEFLTRLYFSKLYAPEHTASIFATQARVLTANIQRLEELLRDLPADQTTNRLSLSLRLRQLLLIREWMAEIRTQFQIPMEATT